MQPYWRKALIVLAALMAVNAVIFASKTASGFPALKPSPPGRFQAIEDARFDKWSSMVAGRKVSVNCPSTYDWNKDWNSRGTWGYTYLGDNVTNVAPILCHGVLAVANGNRKVAAWQRALGVLVLTHEAYHLRDVSWNGNEGVVENHTIRHFKVAVQILGGTKADADYLLPYALAFHYRLVSSFKEYDCKRSENRLCKRVPWWYNV